MALSLTHHESEHPGSAGAAPGTTVYSQGALWALAAFAAANVLGAAMLLSLGFGSPSNFLAAMLWFSPSLLPCCAIVALVKERFVLSKVLVGLAVLGNVVLIVEAFVMAVGYCFTDASTPPPGCSAARPHLDAAIWVFIVAGVYGLLLLLAPFRRRPQ